MTKRKIVEVIEEFSDDGKLTRKTTTETTEDDDTNYYPNWSVVPYTYPGPYTPTCGSTGQTAVDVPLNDITVTCNATNGTNK